MRLTKGKTEIVQDTRLLNMLACLLRDEMPADLNKLNEVAIHQLLHLCTIHGIEPLIDATLARTPIQSNPIDSLKRHLQPRIQAQATAELVKKVAIVRLLKEFAEASIPVAILKGTALGYTLYPAPYYRTRGDLDLIISEQDRDATDALLLRGGYERLDASREAGCFQVSYSKSQPRYPIYPVDLHWKLNDLRLFSDLLPPEQLLQASKPAPMLSEHARTLSAVHTMLHACMHRAANFTTIYHVGDEKIINPDRLIWLYDIHLLAKSFTTPDWDHLCELAEKHRLRAVCRDALIAANRYLNTPLPSTAMQRLTNSGPTEPSAAYLRRGLSRRLLADAKAQPNWPTRITLIASYALPSTEYMHLKYKNKNWPLPALYLLHLGRGIRKLLLT